MNTATKRKPVAALFCQVFFESHTEEGLYRVWNLAQEEESQDEVHFRTHQSANDFHELQNVRQDDDGMWRADCFVERHNVRGNWLSDLQRTLNVAVSRAKIKATAKAEVIERIETEE